MHMGKTISVAAILWACCATLPALAQASATAPAGETPVVAQSGERKSGQAAAEKRKQGKKAARKVKKAKKAAATP